MSLKGKVAIVTGGNSGIGLAIAVGLAKAVDKEHIKGAADKAMGAIKDAAGKMTGDKQMQVEGKFHKAKGAAHEAVGDVKDAARKAARQTDKP